MRSVRPPRLLKEQVAAGLDARILKVRTLNYYLAGAESVTPLLLTIDY